MFPLSEFTAKPSCSKTYQRLIIIVYAITIGFILSSSLVFIVQWALILILGFYCKKCFTQRTAHPEVISINYSNKKWRFQSLAHFLDYDKLELVVANNLFQLIKVSNGDKSKIYVFFTDQFTSQEWRLIYLISAPYNKQ
ncbi:MAG: hypothetical protein CK426_04390 [Legionella sp.]|nr:MAG: hypothetical protein CK423_03640 [Legionella sp.]PJD98925.1 MAG: hypothetical protein CK426_04390 [Legionella sp.]